MRKNAQAFRAGRHKGRERGSRASNEHVSEVSESALPAPRMFPDETNAANYAFGIVRLLKRASFTKSFKLRDVPKGSEKYTMYPHDQKRMALFFS